MNIFELFGTIAVHNQDANKAINDTGKKGAYLATKMGKAFDKVGKFAVNCGKVMAKGLAVGSAAMAGLVVKGMNLAGELEQNMGGSEQVFKEFAKTMQKTAQEAYKNMGLSQSEYLATANKMGALFQGVGYSIEDSADITQKAMQRASDVASIMGIDVSTAMESIAGAAKGNFTMMDNLGVAVNDTAIANYALEKGITKSTQKMSTQEKVALAMELFLEKTAYAAGNYAKENDTLAGSLTTAKAAFQNFLSGAGDADALTDALVNAGGVITKNLNKLLPSLVKGMNKLMTNLTPKLPELIRTTLPGIIEGASALLTGLAMSLPDMIDVVIDVLPETLKNLGRGFERAWYRGVWPMIQDLFKFAFNIELPKWHKFKLELRQWWDTKVFPYVQSICKVLFGIDLANTKITVQSIKDWWEGVKKSIGAWGDFFAATFKLGFSAGVDNKTWGEQIQEWWDGLEYALFVTFGVKTPGGVVDMIKNWWKDLTKNLALSIVFDLTPSGNVVPNSNSGKTTQSTGMKSGIFGVSALSDFINNTKRLFEGKSDESTDGSHASGLDFVPKDGYRAELHYGEAVLTRKEADAWRKGNGNAQLAAKLDQMQDTFVQAMEAVRNQPVAIQVDSRAVAVLMAKEMTRSIGNRNIQTLMGMGG